MNIISFSLWGNSPIYNIGLIRNFELHEYIYKDWNFMVYYDDSIHPDTKTFILNNNITSVNMTGSLIPGEFWRFLANDINNNGYTIFRDCDSRISNREELAVEDWIQSGKHLHVMRDHPHHRIPLGINETGMLAGMWGLKSGLINIESAIHKFMDNYKMKWGCDQKFIHHIYKKFIDNMYINDPYFTNNPFPIERENYHFIGERFDENDKRFNDYLIIKQHENRLRNS